MPDTSPRAYYNQGTGKLVFRGTTYDCYSGFPPHVNDTGAEGLHDKGPIPRGRYFVSAPQDDDKLGPGVLDLTPDSATDTFGRTLFRWHGDSITEPGKASHGCIVGAVAEQRRACYEAGLREIVVI